MDKTLFSKRLVDLRKARGYTSQYALAKAYNEKFPPKRRDDAGGNEGNFRGILGTIKHYENGDFRSSPKLDIVCNLCKLLECDVSYLVGDYDEMNFATHRICEYIGLDAKAVECLMQIKHKAEIERIFGYSGNMLAPNTQGLKALSYLLQHNSIKGREFLRTLYSLVFGNYDRFAIDMETDSGEIAVATSYVAALVDKETGKSQNVVSIKSLEKIYMLEIQEYFWALRDIARGERAERIAVDFKE